MSSTILLVGGPFDGLHYELEPGHPGAVVFLPADDDGAFHVYDETYRTDSAGHAIWEYIGTSGAAGPR